MRKVCFQAVLAGLCVFVSMTDAQYPNQFNQRYPLFPANTNPVINNGVSTNGYTGFGTQGIATPYQSAANPNANRAPAWQNQVNRNRIQQPQFYGNPALANPPVPRTFVPSNGYTPAQAQVPQVARNPRVPNPWNGYGNQDAPIQDQPVSPSDLPVPGQNVPAETLPGNHSQQLGPGTTQPGVMQATPIQPVPANQGYAVDGGCNNCQAPAGNYGLGAGCGYGYGGYAGYPAPGIGGFGAGFGLGMQQGCGIYAPGVLNQGAWFGSLGGLVFFRDLEDDKFLAYPAGMPTNKYLVSTDADPGAMGGLEAVFGKQFCNGTGFQVVYWGLFSDTASAMVSGMPQTPWQTIDMLSYNGATVDTYLNAAAAYRINRTNEFHNIELNFFRMTLANNINTCNACGSCGSGYGGGLPIRAGGFGANCSNGCGGCNGSCGGGCSSCANGGGYGPAYGCRPGIRPGFIRSRNPFQFNVLAGVRFFKFDENICFHTSTTGDFMPNANDLYYDIDVDNNLVGFQLGGDVRYCLTPRWSIVSASRFGIYGNSITHRQQIYGSAGDVMPNAGAYTGQPYNLSSSKTDVAFLGQLDLGLQYAINCRWNLGFGYRVLSVTGVALAPEQIPYDFSDYQDANYVDSNSGLILHGAYMRLQYNF